VGESIATTPLDSYKLYLVRRCATCIARKAQHARHDLMTRAVENAFSWNTPIIMQ
jgi:hypothetical protein